MPKKLQVMGALAPTEVNVTKEYVEEGDQRNYDYIQDLYDCLGVNIPYANQVENGVSPVVKTVDEYGMPEAWEYVELATKERFDSLDRFVGVMDTRLGEDVPSVETAKVGQTVRVASVAPSGKPDAWEAVDFPSEGVSVDGWEFISDITLTAEDGVWRLVIDKKDDGTPFEYQEICLYSSTLAATTTSLARVFLNQEYPYQGAYCATINGYFVTNAQSGGVTYIKNMCSTGDNPWFQVMSNRGTAGAYIGRHRSQKNNDSSTIRAFGIETSGDTVLMSGRFILYGR